MKSALECLLCLFRQALNAAKLATDDERLQRQVINRVAGLIPSINLNLSPAAISRDAYTIVTKVTGVHDPYQFIKQRTNQQALRMLPRLRALLDESGDRLGAALRVAVAGNIIDLGIGHQYDLEQDVVDMMRRQFAINDIESFRTYLKPGIQLLYLGDNSGEIVFDRILVEELLKTGVKIYFAVKSGPIINDAMREDARVAGIESLVDVIETGSADIGINFERSGHEFLRIFRDSDLILAKGHGNFETCDDMPYNLFFLLKAKCSVVARTLGVNAGDIVFKRTGVQL